MDLEVARTDRRLDAVAVSSGVRERLARLRNRSPEEPQHTPCGGRSLPAFAGRTVSRAASEPLQLVRKRRADGDQGYPHDPELFVLGASDNSGHHGRAPSPGRPPPSMRAAAFRSAAAGTASISASSPGSRTELDAGRRQRESSVDSGRRASASPPVIAQTSASEPSATSFELVGAIADDRDPRRLEPQRDAPREERPVRSVTFASDGSLPVTTIAARGRPLSKPGPAGRDPLRAIGTRRLRGADTQERVRSSPQCDALQASRC